MNASEVSQVLVSLSSAGVAESDQDITSHTSTVMTSSTSAVIDTTNDMQAVTVAST